LNRRLGFLESNQGLRLFPRRRQDYPLSIPINRSRFHAQEEKIERKVGKKPAFPAHFSCNQPFLFFFSPLWPSATTTFTTALTTVLPTKNYITFNTQQPHVVAATPLSLPLSSLRNSFPPSPPQPQQQQQQPPFPAATTLPEALRQPG